MVCLLVAVRAPAARAQETPRLTEWSDVSVITILPGDPLYSSFGHTAIRVRDDSADIDVGYNYGTFDFDEEGFYVKFLRGKLDYYLDRNRFDDVLYAYRMEERPVLEQRLNFTLEERQELFDRLETNYLPENRAYRYEFLYDNCSTRPRDVIEAVWGYKMAGNESSEAFSLSRSDRPVPRRTDPGRESASTSFLDRRPTSSRPQELGCFFRTSFWPLSNRHALRTVSLSPNRQTPCSGRRYTRGGPGPFPGLQSWAGRCCSSLPSYRCSQRIVMPLENF